MVLHKRYLILLVHIYLALIPTNNGVETNFLIFQESKKIFTIFKNKVQIVEILYGNVIFEKYLASEASPETVGTCLSIFLKTLLSHGTNPFSTSFVNYSVSAVTKYVLHNNQAGYNQLYVHFFSLFMKLRKMCIQNRQKHSPKPC